MKLSVPVLASGLLLLSGCAEPSGIAVEESASVDSTGVGNSPDEVVGEMADDNSPIDPSKLQIGMVAPEIVGADLDGVEFRLSDYRGKVVLLDFWGNW